jgi:hypothetical protein
MTVSMRMGVDAALRIVGNHRKMLYYNITAVH